MKDKAFKKRARCVPLQSESSWLHRDLHGFTHYIATEHFPNPNVVSSMTTTSAILGEKTFLLYFLIPLFFFTTNEFSIETQCPLHFKSSLYSISFSVKMPVDRMRMRPWLEQQIESGQIQGLHWVNEVRVEI